MGTRVFEVEGGWFRGNIHTHTINSDGELSPREVAKFYAEKGYDFLVFTDHWKITCPSLPSLLTVIPGVEVDLQTGPGTNTHLVLIGVGEPPFDRHASPAEVVEFAKAQGGVVVLAHPYWSGLELADFFHLDGLDGLEVFNYSCLLGMGRGESTVHWDGIIERGKTIWGIACDDSHFRYPDAAGGWIWVKAESNRPEALIRAMREGLFYSSSGPKIEEFKVEGSRAFVRCSPAVMVKFICQRERGFVAFDPHWRPSITKCEAELPYARYVRVEVIDQRGRKAWTNPVALV